MVFNRCHNWIYFNYAEKRNELNYKGWLSKKDIGTVSSTFKLLTFLQIFDFQKAKVVKVKFSIKGLDKILSSFFIGTSPELEIALYTICFKVRLDKGCKLGYDKARFTIITHSLGPVNKRYIGTAFVAI